MSKVGQIALTLEVQPQEFLVEALGRALPLAWIRDALSSCGPGNTRERCLPSHFMVWFVILLGLFRRVSYVNLLEKLHGMWWTSRHWDPEKPPSSTAVTKARDRLGVEPVKRLFERSAREWNSQSEGLKLGGRRVLAIDGTTFKTPDSDENREFFGLPGASRGKSAYPQMRAVALSDVGTHLASAVRQGPYHTGEITLARELREEVPAGSLVVMDRNFLAYDFLWDILHSQKADYIVRLKDNIKPRVIQPFARGDALVEVTIHAKARRENPELPATWTLRQITYRPDGGDEEIRLLTTLIDPENFSRDELAACYHDRWEQENSFDELKTHQCDCTTVNRPVIFRSQRPERVEQELYGLLIAYNAIRIIMVEAAAEATKTETAKAETVETVKKETVPAETAVVEVTPLRLSFTSALERIREATRDMMQLRTLDLPARYQRMLKAIGRGRVPKRPGRHNPRAVKIKMSKYPVKRRSAV